MDGERAIGILARGDRVSRRLRAKAENWCDSHWGQLRDLDLLESLLVNGLPRHGWIRRWIKKFIVCARALQNGKRMPTRWVQRQRQRRREGDLRREYIDLLNWAGFSWSRDENKRRCWLKWFNKLSACRRHGGYCRFEGNLGLEKWACKQRRHFDELAKWQQDALKRIHFALDVKNSWLDHWLGQVRKFRHQHGHACIPYEYPRNQCLAYWACQQRSLYRRRQIEPSVAKRLNPLGFVWDHRAWHWNNRLALVRQYVERRLGREDHHRVGRWLGKVRKGEIHLLPRERFSLGRLVRKLRR